MIAKKYSFARAIGAISCGALLAACGGGGGGGSSGMPGLLNANMNPTTLAFGDFIIGTTSSAKFLTAEQYQNTSAKYR